MILSTQESLISSTRNRFRNKTNVESVFSPPFACQGPSHLSLSRQPSLCQSMASIAGGEGADSGDMMVVTRVGRLGIRWAEKATLSMSAMVVVVGKVVVVGGPSSARRPHGGGPCKTDPRRLN